MTANELRRKFLDFMKSKGHTIVPSASLVPENDPTTLFTGSGMQPMIPYLLGEKHPAGNKLADSQKCFRTVDIEEVGDWSRVSFGSNYGIFKKIDGGMRLVTGGIHSPSCTLVNSENIPNQIYHTCK